MCDEIMESNEIAELDIKGSEIGFTIKNPTFPDNEKEIPDLAFNQIKSCSFSKKTNHPNFSQQSNHANDSSSTAGFHNLMKELKVDMI